MAVQPIGQAHPEAVRAEPSSSGGERFAKELARTLGDVNRDQVEAAAAAERLMVRGEGSIHEAMVAMSKAEGSFRLVMEVRNRLVAAIERLMQTQV